MRPLLARRSLLSLAAACPLCAATAVRAQTAPHDAHDAPHWSYEGAGGPEKWGELSADFRTCSLGTQQTPVDLLVGIRAQTGPVAFRYQKMPLTVLNNGHTIQVNAPAGSHVMLGDTSYELLQFHFHHPSEHLLAGKGFEMEGHFVHRAANGALAVVGVFIKPGAANAALAPIWQAMPDKEAPATAIPGVTVDTAALLPKDRVYFRYMGSLTTPPCTEGITWTVFRAPVEASPEQIRRFATLFPLNARPVQPLNRRFLLESGA
ncbi:MAG: carbonic anhydrase family protein [Acetobacteraceae bacterium]|nr:carbonic anhydrase family protein [Acetobacteraceae bacterium]